MVEETGLVKYIKFKNLDVPVYYGLHLDKNCCRIIWEPRIIKQNPKCVIIGSMDLADERREIILVRINSDYSIRNVIKN